MEAGVHVLKRAETAEAQLVAQNPASLVKIPRHSQQFLSQRQLPQLYACRGVLSNDPPQKKVLRYDVFCDILTKQ